jgi:squalene-hopene/tetraprenyl-beta-curcumene cyclase
MPEILRLHCFVLFAATAASSVQAENDTPQYVSGSIVVPGASVGEEKLESFSPKLADRYLANGALAWCREHRCVTCHTTGSYLAIRPSLTAQLGPPERELRELFVKELNDLSTKADAELHVGATPTQIAYVAWGLAEWDKHVTKGRSAETDQALELLFRCQQEEDGSWGNDDCWPPLESSHYHGTTVAAMAVATAPGWLEQIADEPTTKRVEKLKTYLRTTTPPHDYGRLLLLWTSSRFADLLDEAAVQELIELVFSHQREDGGWSMRTLADPEQWGNGSRAKKIRQEEDFDNPASDGHLTGLAIIALRDAGISSIDPRIQYAVGWLKQNQRVSGRWWTRSLNNDSDHYITFSSTAYALLALAKCDAF